MQLRHRKLNPVYLAALTGDVERITALKNTNYTEFKAMALETDDYGIRALDCAAARGWLVIVTTLVKVHNESGYEYKLTSSTHYHPILTAVRAYLKSLDREANKAYFYNGKFNTSAHFHQDYYNIIKLLLENFPYFADVVDNKGCNALYYVVHELGNTYNTDPNRFKSAKKIARLLLKHGSSLDTKGYDTYTDGPACSTPRNLAKRKNVIHVVEELESSIKNESVKLNKKLCVEKEKVIYQEKKSTPVQSSSNIQPVLQVLNKEPIKKEITMVTNRPKSQHLVKPVNPPLFALSRYTVLNDVNETKSIVENIELNRKSPVNVIAIKPIINEIMSNFKKFAEANEIAAEVTQFCTRNQKYIQSLSPLELEKFKKALRKCIEIKEISHGFLFCKRIQTILTLDTNQLESLEVGFHAGRKVVSGKAKLA